VAVAEEKHFGRAAERLRIAQPGLSQQIKMLEQSLGTKLLVRDQRHVELTPAGETFLQHANHLLALVDRAVESARLRADGKTGVITVGTPASGINPIANELLQTFRARFPAVEVVLRPGVWPQNAEALRRGALDIAFVNGPPESEDAMGYVRLGVAEVMIVLPESHPLTAHERIPRVALRDEPFIGLSAAADRIVVDDVHRKLFGDGEPPNLIESPDGAELTRVVLVLQGKGLSATFLPAISELHIPGVAYRRIEDPAPFVEHGIVWVETTATELVDAFVHLARELAAEMDPGGTHG
jgi:DNA-binding transcriptional LysR family regulator